MNIRPGLEVDCQLKLWDFFPILWLSYPSATPGLSAPGSLSATVSKKGPLSFSDPNFFENCAGEKRSGWEVVGRVFQIHLSPTTQYTQIPNK